MKRTGNSICAKEILASRLKQARKDKKLTRQEVADLLCENSYAPNNEFSFERLKQWEYGKNAVNVEWIPALCDVLDCDVGYLFGQYEAKNYQAASTLEQTGLSTRAAENLVQIKNNSGGKDYWYEMLKYISFLLEHYAEMLVEPMINVLEHTRSLEEKEQCEAAYNRLVQTRNTDFDTTAKLSKMHTRINTLNDICAARHYLSEKAASAAMSDFIKLESEQEGVLDYYADK